MKPWKYLLTAVLVLLCLSGCRESVPAEASEPQDSTTTLMVYMVGSDLEAKAGAATKDLAEIAESGVDLSKVNVLVYTGGAPHWHNEAASSEEHRILQLTDEGFMPIAATASVSMGQSECLTDFLTYAWENHPADQYALILWDHGDGPVIGYGRDMLFDNDTLTLKEMEAALAASPFGEENKLAWVGFDACLMASAELSCVWAPYAHFLVASQEVEPSFGWNYSFLSGLGNTDTPALLEAATSAYLTTCQEYYESRGYEQRDTTLSCVDLSLASELEAAINGLFSRAAQDVGSQYNALTARRVQTRALGRATTGSEYDLIDLKDLTTQLQDLYPEEAAAVQTVLEKMVTANAANADGCCGMSLYYPFYNKAYYTQSWGEAYAQLDVFPDYLTYLQAYEAVWLQNDLLATVAASQVPEEAAGQYTLQLTPEQTEVFASARYYILIRDGEEYYTRAFSSENVTNENGLLTANFDGSVLYVKDNYGNYHIPISQEHDTVGDVTRYSVYTTMANYVIGLTADLPEGFEEVTEPHRFSLSLNNTTKTVSVNGLVPYDYQSQSDALAGGKEADTDLSDWAACFFHNSEHRYLTRDENGTILGLESWPADSMFSGRWMSVEDGVEFVYAPLTAGEYYLIFEIEDTQGNRYCSELLPIETDGTLETVPAPDPIAMDWSSGDRITLTEQSGVTLSLLKTEDFGAPGYKLEAVNTNDFPVLIDGGSLFWGDDLYCHDNTGWFTVSPGETAEEDYGFDFGAISELGLLESAGTMQLSVTVQNAITGASLLYEQPFRITLSEQVMLTAPDTAAYYSFTAPLCDALAEEQLLLDTEDVKVTLLGFGGNGMDSTFRGAVYIENRTDQPLILEPEGVALNGVYLSANFDTVTLPANSKTYQRFTIDSYQLEQNGITSVGEMQLLLRQSDYSPLFSGNSRSQLIWCPAELAQSGTASPFPEGETVLLEQDGIRISLLRSENTDSKCTWYLSIVNDSDTAISVDVTDCPSKLYTYSAQTGAHQKCVGELTLYKDDTDPENVTFRFRIMDFNGEAIEFTAEDLTTLHCN